MASRELRYLAVVLLSFIALAGICISGCNGAKEELDNAILNEETGELYNAKMLSGMTTDGQDCILVHHTGCTSKARWKCMTCESGDHIAADPFTSCHVNFEPLEGASLVRMTCKAVSHLTDGMSFLVNTGYYPKNFPTALRKCTWPHERLPARRPHRLTLCNETQELYEGLRRERLLADDSQCTPAGAGNGCKAKECKKTGGTAGKGCGCEGNCCPTGKNKGEPCMCTDLGPGENGKSKCECKATPANPVCSKKINPGFNGDGCKKGVCKNNANCDPNGGCVPATDRNGMIFCTCTPE